jgi:hypothetical protein
VNDRPRAFLFRRTRRNQRTRLGLDCPETLTFAEPEQVDAEDWNRACRRIKPRPTTGAFFAALIAARSA